MADTEGPDVARLARAATMLGVTKTGLRKLLSKTGRTTYTQPGGVVGVRQASGLGSAVSGEVLHTGRTGEGVGGRGRGDCGGKDGSEASMSETSERCANCKHRAWVNHWFGMAVPEYNAMRRAMLRETMRQHPTFRAWLAERAVRLAPGLLEEATEHHETSERSTGPEPVPVARRTLRRVRARVVGHLPAWVGAHESVVLSVQATDGVPGGSRGAQLAAAAGGVAVVGPMSQFRVSQVCVIEPGSAARFLRSEARRCALAERLGVPLERVPVDVGSGPAVRLLSRRALGHDEGEESGWRGTTSTICNG